MQLETPVIEARLKDGRAFPPPEEFRAHAKVTDDTLHREAAPWRMRGRRSD
jgi:hypothetical protein